MLDIGLGEVALIAVLALLVFGPDRLPGAARMAGLWVGRLKRSFNAIKTEVERELGADEIRRQLHNEQILQLEREMQQSIQPPNPVENTPVAAESQAPANPPKHEQP